MPKVKLFDEQEILQKAVLLFWEKGYYHTSMNDLVQHLGISRSSLYSVFKGGKKELYDKAFARYRAAECQNFFEFIEQEPDVKKGIRMIFQKIIQTHFTDEQCKGCFVVNATTELAPADLTIQKAVTEHRHLMEQLLVDFLKKGVANGQISPSTDIKMMASLLYTLMSGFQVVGKTRPPASESMASVEAVLSLID